MQLKELTVSYSVGMKASLPHNKFENAQIHVSRTEVYEISEGDDAEKLYNERYQALQKELGDLCVEKYENVKNGEL